MNLLTEPWMPVRKRDGSRVWIAPDQISEPDLVAFDADRADFNGALAQFAIGLLQTTVAVENSIEWRRYFREPPAQEALGKLFSAVVSAFEFDGDGARFMQDFDLRVNAGIVRSIDALLIETPGDKSLDDNSDHFVKRRSNFGLCPHCAATALLTLQLNAPSGGAGHRTSLRGGGPLTTLLIGSSDAGLWANLWLNVMEHAQLLAAGGDPAKEDFRFRFPWMGSVAALQAQDGETAPSQVHPLHVYWATPRRIRLDFGATTSGMCDICDRGCQCLLTSYRTQNYGMNYKGAWMHPLSPYYLAQEQWLPLHPQPGGIGYRHWLPWVLGQTGGRKVQRRASVVELALSGRSRNSAGALRIWAFGYDMDNMKARCWYEATLPTHGLADCTPDSQRRVEAEVTNWLAAAELAASYLRNAIKDAWFGGEARGDFSIVDASFWHRTESTFYALLKRLIDAEHDALPFDTAKERDSWHRHIVATALSLFDEEFVGAGSIDRQNPKRVAEAFKQLKRNLYGPKMSDAIGIARVTTSKSTHRRSNQATAG